MSNAYFIFIYYFLITLALFTTCYYIGSSISRLFSKSSENEFNSQIFFNTIIGSTTLVFILAIIYSKGKTINLIFLPLLIFWLFEKLFINQNKIDTSLTPKSSINFKNIWGLILLIFIIFLWHASIVLESNAFAVNHIEKDNFFYAEISKCLISTGNENTFAATNLIDENYRFPTPYHYFDLWLNGFISQIFNLNHSVSLFLIIYTFFSSLLVIGFLACMEFYGELNRLSKVLAFLLLFIGGLYITENVFHIFAYNAQMDGMTVRFGGKLSAVYCFSLAAILLFLKGNLKASLLVLLSIPIISISLAPGIYGGVLLYCIYHAIKSKDQRKEYLRFIFYTLSAAFSIAFFYYISNKNALNYRFNKPIQAYSDFTEFTWFRIKFFVVELFLKSYLHPILFFLNYFPFMFIILFLIFTKSIQNKFKSLVLLFSLIWLGAMLAFNSLYLMDDAFQLYINVLAMWHVLFGVGFIVFYYQINWKKNLFTKTLATIFISATICYSAFAWYSYQELDHFDTQFSEKYIIEVNKECDKFKTTTLGCTFYDKQFYDNLLITYPLEYYCVPFIMSPNFYSPYNLTPSNIPQKRNRYQIEKSLEKSPFTQYLISKNKAGILKDTLQFQLDFIKENNIKYLICPKEQDITFVNKLLVNKIITDSLTGQRFIILN